MSHHQNVRELCSMPRGSGATGGKGGILPSACSAFFASTIKPKETASHSIHSKLICDSPHSG
jgi:hypothetical protein